MLKQLLVGVLLVTSSQFLLASPDLDAAAKDVCKCMDEPNKRAAQAIEMIRQAQASGDMSQITIAQGDMMGVMTAATRCFEALPAKYPEIDKSDELKNRVMELAEQQCPNPANQLMR